MKYWRQGSVVFVSREGWMRLRCPGEFAYFSVV